MIEDEMYAIARIARDSQPQWRCELRPIRKIQRHGRWVYVQAKNSVAVRYTTCYWCWASYNSSAIIRRALRRQFPNY